MSHASVHVGEKNLNVDSLYIKYIQANRAAHMRRRTHRAHGRIGGAIDIRPYSPFFLSFPNSIPGIARAR